MYVDWIEITGGIMASLLEMRRSDYCLINRTLVFYWEIVKVYKEVILSQFGEQCLWILYYSQAPIFYCIGAKQLCNLHLSCI